MRLHGHFCYFVLMLKKISISASFLISLMCLAQQQDVAVRSITFTGNRSIDSDRLKGLMRFCRIGGILQPDGLSYDLTNLERLYQNEGFLKAKVGPPQIDIKSEPPKSPFAVVTIPIVEGDPYTTGKIAVKNASAFDPTVLLRMCPLKEGEPFRRAYITDWVEKVEEGYRTMGYLRFTAKVIEDVQERPLIVNCTLELKEGKAYSIGKILIEGDPAVDGSEFKRHLLIGEGGLYNPEMVYLSLQYLNRMGKYKYISERDVEVKIDDIRNTVDLIFHIGLPKGTNQRTGSL